MGSFRARKSLLSCTLQTLRQSKSVLLLITGLPMIIFLQRPAPIQSICTDPFYVSVPGTTNTPHKTSRWPCYVPPPPEYRPPLDPVEGLWRVPRANLGELNTTNPEYHLHISRQRWARMSEDFVNIRPEGGTSGRAFVDNYDYVKTLLDVTKRTPRCGRDEAPLMLDMGAGIGSVAAAMKDARGARGAMRILSYVWPDDYLRLQTIIADRGLPAFLANFTGRLPFPGAAFDVVHCKWCWHHVAGYNVWLREVERLLVPGGFFIFTLSSGGDDILRQEEWDAALARRRGFSCERARKIILVCRKRFVPPRGEGALGEDFCPRRVREALQSSTRAERRRARGTQETGLALRGVDHGGRLLNVNCPDSRLCVDLETRFVSTLHVSAFEMDKPVGGLLGLRRTAMLHDWSEHVPVYPRSFDVVNVGCSRGTRGLLRGREFWVEMHRVLRPGGVVVVVRSFCPWLAVRALKNTAFEVNALSRDVVVARRLVM